MTVAVAIALYLYVVGGAFVAWSTYSALPDLGVNEETGHEHALGIALKISVAAATWPLLLPYVLATEFAAARRGDLP